MELAQNRFAEDFLAVQSEGIGENTSRLVVLVQNRSEQLVTAAGFHYTNHLRPHIDGLIDPNTVRGLVEWCTVQQHAVEVIVELFLFGANVMQVALEDGECVAIYHTGMFDVLTDGIGNEHVLVKDLAILIKTIVE